MVKFLFCYNQISYVIAKNITVFDNCIHIIFYTKNRINKSQSKKNIIELNYSTFLTFILLILSSLFAFIEIVIPHTNGGKLIKFISKYGKNVSYIDDGLDTFRVIPKNLNLTSIQNYTTYYTFDYDIPIAKWTTNFNLIKVIKINELYNSNKLSLKLHDFKNLIIDSPNIEFVLNNKIDQAFLIKHPNKNKKTVLNDDYPCINGNEISVEKTISNFNGNIYIGETFLIVYILATYKNLDNIKISLNYSNYQNLEVLHSNLKKCGMLHIS
jgi:hypothetical protein